MSRSDAEWLLDRRAEATEHGAEVEYGVLVRHGRIATRCALSEVMAEAARLDGWPAAIVDGKAVPLNAEEFERAKAGP